MGWKIRPKELSSNIPAYGTDSSTEFFTIKMHHGGKFFKNLGFPCYLGSEVSYIDFCHPDEMSFIELKSMISDLGLSDVLCISCSRSGVDQCLDLIPIETDFDAMNLVNYVDSNRVVGVFVEPVQNQDAEIGEGVTQDGLVGIEDVADDFHVGSGVQVNDGAVGQMSLDRCDYVEHAESDDSSDAQSFGSNSDLSETVPDSEFDGITDDDLEFVANVDEEVEFGGVNHNTPPTNEPCASRTRSKGKGKLKSKATSQPRRQLFPDPEFYVGQAFNDSNEFRKQVRLHSISVARDYKFTINNKFKVQARCKHSKCKWVILGSKAAGEDTFRVKTYNEVHKCPRKQKVKATSARLLGEVYKDKIYTDPRWPVDSMQKWISKDLHIHVNKHQLYRAKNFVLKRGSVGDNEQYSMLWSYAEEIRNTNPGTTVKLKVKPIGDVVRFKRFYICWDSLKRGFMEGCRPIMFLDGCHLKGSVGGMILSVVGIDGNNGIFPFAYAIVEKEKKKTWTWFMQLVLEDLGVENYHHWTVMSDKQKGLVDAIEHLMPGCEHRFCVQHLYQNFKVHHKGFALKNLLWKAARASRVVDFKTTMGEIMARDRAAYDWLVARPPHHWSRSHFSTHSSCDKLENNMSESFNAMILKARNLPIVKLLESIRLDLMKRLYTRRDLVAKYHGALCPVADKLLEELKKKSCEYIPHWNGLDQFEIEVVGGSKFKVHLGDKTCSCRKWQLSGMPCAHAISGLNFMEWDVEDYVSHWYTKDTFFKSYNHMLGALESSEEWPETTYPQIIPPKVERMPGRPKLKKRKSQPGETKTGNSKKKDGIVKLSRKGMNMSCSLCHKADHNIRCCPLKPPPSPVVGVRQGMDIPPTNTEGPSRARKRKVGCGRPTKNPSTTKKKSKGKGKTAVDEVEDKVGSDIEGEGYGDIPDEWWDYSASKSVADKFTSGVTNDRNVNTQISVNDVVPLTDTSIPLVAGNQSIDGQQVTTRRSSRIKTSRSPTAAVNAVSEKNVRNRKSRAASAVILPTCSPPRKARVTKTVTTEPSASTPGEIVTRTTPTKNVKGAGKTDEITPKRYPPPRNAKKAQVVNQQTPARKKLEVRRAPKVIPTQSSQAQPSTANEDENEGVKALAHTVQDKEGSIIPPEIRFSTTLKEAAGSTFITSQSGETSGIPPSCKQM